MRLEPQKVKKIPIDPDDLTILSLKTRNGFLVIRVICPRCGTEQVLVFHSDEYKREFGVRAGCHNLGRCGTSLWWDWKVGHNTKGEYKSIKDEPLADAQTEAKSPYRKLEVALKAHSTAFLNRLWKDVIGLETTDSIELNDFPYVLDLGASIGNLKVTAGWLRNTLFMILDGLDVKLC